MGYSLRIGEAVLDWSEDMVRVDCEIVKRDDAPAFGDPTDYESQRWPSYSSWADAMRTLDMMDVMFNERNKGRGYFEWNAVERCPLIECHPGAVPVTKEHVEYVAAKLAKYKEMHPDHIAQYAPLKEGAVPIAPGCGIYREDQYVDDPKYDGALCRGEWLLYWLRWAVENCQQPVFVNT